MERTAYHQLQAGTNILELNVGDNITPVKVSTVKVVDDHISLFVLLFTFCYFYYLTFVCDKYEE